MPTITPIPTGTPTLEPTSTITATPDPTLTDLQVQENVIAALKNNGDCKLPCWWGIIPGQTTWQEADSLLREVGLNTHVDAISGKYNGHLFFSGDEDSLIFTLEFSVQNGIVNDINANAEGYYSPTAFKRVFVGLAPENIIPAYGPPTRVMVNGDVGGEGGGSANIHYGIILVYDNLGFFLGYSGTIPYNDPNSRFCPTFGEGGNLNTGLTLFMQSQDVSLAVGQSSDSLQDAARMTPQDLYALYTQTKKPICFDTPTDLWK